MQNDRSAAGAADIYNCAWWIRHYNRPGKQAERAKAMRGLGLVVYAALERGDDFEPLLLALLDAFGGKP